MSHYYYVCSDCKKEYPAFQIEKDLIYLCPACGKAERNQPLKGVLRIKYDYAEIKRKKFPRKKFSAQKLVKSGIFPKCFHLSSIISKINFH